MKKKVKKCRNDLKFLVIILFILLIVSLGGVFVYRLYVMTHPFYQVVSKVSDVERVQKNKREPIVGWLRVQGTNIDYPIVHNAVGVDLDEFNYDYVWTNSVSTNKLGNREIIFGHNVRNVSRNPLITYSKHVRFEQLMSFIYYDFAKENEYIQYTINGKDYLYKIFAVEFINDEKLDYLNKDYSKKELTKYIDSAKQNSFYEYDVDVDSSDDILSLVTCTRFYGTDDAYIDFKVDARKVRQNETISKYRVAESKKYDKIKEEMKGDAENEEV